MAQLLHQESEVAERDPKPRPFPKITETFKKTDASGPWTGGPRTIVSKQVTAWADEVAEDEEWSLEEWSSVVRSLAVPKGTSGKVWRDRRHSVSGKDMDDYPSLTRSKSLPNL